MSSESNDQTRVLFVCVHNAARSQMAEAFLNRLGEGKFAGESAGFTPSPISPYVIRAMAEIGYDLSGKQSNDVFVYFRQERKYDIVVKVCDLESGQRCPIFPSTRITLNWPFPDPAGFTGTDEMIMDRVRKLRDDILARVRELIDTYGG